MTFRIWHFMAQQDTVHGVRKQFSLGNLKIWSLKGKNYLFPPLWNTISLLYYFPSWSFIWSCWCCRIIYWSWQKNSWGLPLPLNDNTEFLELFLLYFSTAQYKSFQATPSPLNNPWYETFPFLILKYYQKSLLVSWQYRTLQNHL